MKSPHKRAVVKWAMDYETQRMLIVPAALAVFFVLVDIIKKLLSKRVDRSTGSEPASSGKQIEQFSGQKRISRDTNAGATGSPRGLSGIDS